MNAFSIKDIENLSGVKAHTIRIWEKRYNFLNPNRSFTNIRSYSNEELKELLNVALLIKYGFKISAVNNMTEVERREKILSLENITAQYDRILNELMVAMVDMKLDVFESIVDRFILSRGIDHTVIHLLFPFLLKIGLLWQTNIVQPAQEHLVSNIIRQKLIVGIETARPTNKINIKIVLFLPEGEQHEIGLLYMHYKLKSLGVEVIYLGAESSLDDIEFLCKSLHPDYLYTHLTAVKNSFNIDKYVAALKNVAPKQSIVISSKTLQPSKKTASKKFNFLQSTEELERFIIHVGQGK